MHAHAHTHIKTKTKNHTGKKTKNKKSPTAAFCKLIQHLAGFFVLFSICFFWSVSFHLSFQHFTQMWDRDWQLSFGKLYPTHQAQETRGKHKPANQKQKSLVNNVTYIGGHSLVNNARHILHWRTQSVKQCETHLHWRTQSGKQCKTHFTLEDTVW